MASTFRFFFISFILGMLSCSPLQAQAAPQRIVSLSLCTDQLLLMLVSEKSTLASISYLAADPEISFLADQTHGIRLNQGQAEEVIALNPDLILSSQFSATNSVNLLKRLGNKVVVLDFPTSINDSYAQIRHVAALIAEEERGEALIAQMQTEIRQSLRSIPDSTRTKTAVFLSSNGFSYGSNTLRNNVLMAVGLKNLAAELGIIGPGQLSLEAVLMAKPDYLLVDAANPHSTKIAHPMLQHPAIKKLFNNDALITLPDTLFQCAGPKLSEAFAILAKALVAK